MSYILPGSYYSWSWMARKRGPTEITHASAQPRRIRVYVKLAHTDAREKWLHQGHIVRWFYNQRRSRYGTRFEAVERVRFPFQPTRVRIEGAEGKNCEIVAIKLRKKHTRGT